MGRWQLHSMRVLSLLVLFPLISSLASSGTEVHRVECNSTMPCAGELVTDCQEVDKPCLIDCTHGNEACKESEFRCHPDQDCTLLCDSQDASDACLGTILNASASTGVDITVICLGSRACEYLVVAANSDNLNLNMTVYDPSNAAFEQYIAKHSEVYTPHSGFAFISCVGHSVCSSMKIHGNLSSYSTPLHVVARGPRAFADSYVSLPVDSDISIVCDSGQDPIGEACSGAVFDGRFGGKDSNIHIDCSGNSGCSNSIIFANPFSTSLVVSGHDGNDVLSRSNIYCPSSSSSSMDSNPKCNIVVEGNSSNMLMQTAVHALRGFRDVIIECKYATSALDNCYPDAQSGPVLYCDESCRLNLQSEQDWQCVDDDVARICHDSAIDSETPSDMDNSNNSSSSSITSSTEVSYPQHSEASTSIGLRHNTKGQIVLSTIIFILIVLCIAVCKTSKGSIREWLYNPFDINTGSSGLQSLDHSVIQIPNHYNSGPMATKRHGKNQYASLDESYSRPDDESEFIVSDETDEEQEYSDE